VIRGPSPRDPGVLDYPFNYDASADLARMRVGYVEDAFKEDGFREHNDRALEKFRALGVQLVPIALPEVEFRTLTVILTAEAGAAFEELTLSGRDDLLVNQAANAWPNIFRTARFIPATEYINANRQRTILCREMNALFEDVDAYLAPPWSDSLLMTNLSGHPCVVFPTGWGESGSAATITIVGPLFGEATILELARAFQAETDHHRRRPNLEEAFARLEGQADASQ